jgi:hypothetical protein
MKEGSWLSTMSRCADSFFSDTISHIFKPIHPQMIQLGKHLPILLIWRVTSINWGFVGHKNEMQFYVCSSQPNPTLNTFTVEVIYPTDSSFLSFLYGFHNYWTCSQTEFSWNTVCLILSNNQSLVSVWFGLPVVWIDRFIVRLRTIVLGINLS